MRNSKNEIIHNKDPFVATYNNVLTDKECEHFYFYIKR